MTDPYGGDPLIIDEGNGGTLAWVAGQPRMSSGLENALYLSWFVDANWWGNDISAADPGAVGSTEFMRLLRSRPILTPGILRDAKKALEADAAWMVEDGVAKSVTVEPSIVAPGVMGIEATTEEPDGATTTSRWKLNWARAKEEAA